MQLQVTLPYSDDEDSLSHSDVTVKSFRDIVAIGHTVARAVREWLRQVPMTPHVKSRNFYISAEWVETTPTVSEEHPGNPGVPPKRRKKAKK